MPDLTLVWTVLAEYPQQWAAAALLLALAVGVVRWTPPPAACGGCGGDMESCRCGTPKSPTPRPFSGGAR